MTTAELAKKILSVLDLQQEYFKTRSGVKLCECRDAERRLRETCLDILNPPQAGLFDGEPQ